MSGTRVSTGTSLAELQGAFQDYLLGSDDAFRSEVRDSAMADRITLLAVYREGYALRLIEALTADYPGLIAMVGEEAFDEIARAYIAALPSRHPAVRWFGRNLSSFLESAAPDNCPSAAAEMARFEWKLGEAWDAADRKPVSADALMALPEEAWETLSFTTIPSLRRLSLAFEVPQAWQRREETAPGALEVVAAPAPVSWVIWRPDLRPRFRMLEGDEPILLDALSTGRTFPELCAALAAETGEDAIAARVAGPLRVWVEAGMIGSFHHRRQPLQANR